MDIQRLQPGLANPPTAAARLNRIGADPGAASRAAGPIQPSISGPQVTSDPKLQSVLSSEESQALEQLFSAFRTAAEGSGKTNYTGRGTVPRLPPLGGGRPGQLIDVVG